ncbi:MAG: hypothetical protein V6Z86_05565 [Hyphomicrobiales bacterium]
MTDTYQAVYDAVRSRIRGCDTGDILRDVVREAFAYTSQMMDEVKNEHLTAAWELQRPTAVFKPSIYPDGNMWCALLGENIQEGVCGFGETPEKAAKAFDLAWINKRTPAAEFGERQADAAEPAP